MLADLVKLGTKKRDNRSIEEIDRDLRAARMGAAGASTQSRRDLEAAEAQLRRQKAMDAKKAGLPHAGSSSPMPTAPSSGPSRSSAEPAVDRFSKDSDRQNGAATAVRTSVPPRPRSSDLTAAAHFLAGVPGHLPPSSSKLASSGSSSQASKSKSKSKIKPDEADEDKKDKKKKKKQSSRADSDPHAEGSKPSGPPRRETARDRFLREEAERKKAASSSSSSGLSGRDRGRAAHNVSYSEDDDDDEGSDASSMSQDTYETDSQASSDVDEGRGGVSTAIGDEIWRMFGKDRSKYVSAIDDDDDDDMEADAESVFREEMRSAQLARKEDEREQRELERRAREKAARRARK